MSDHQTPAPPPRKDVWDIFKAISVAAIVPLVGWFGHQVNITVKERDAQIKTLELAMGVLAQDPATSPETPELRNWAMDVVDAYSGVPLPAPARKELKVRPAPLAPAFAPSTNLSKEEQKEAVKRLKDLLGN